MDLKGKISYKTYCLKGRSFGSICVSLPCMKFLLLTILWNYNESMVTSGFKYKLVNEELTAPQMLCFSGLPPPTTSSSGGGGGNNTSGSSSSSRVNKKKKRYSVSANPCPDFTSRHDLESYDAVVLDMAAYVEVKLVDISMYSTKVDVVGWTTEVAQHHQHRLQLYLVSIDDLIEKIDNRASATTPIRHDHQCCFQIRGVANVSLPHFCKPRTTKEGTLIYDYRVHAPRITGPDGSVSSPITTQVHSLFNDSLPQVLTSTNETYPYDGDISSTNVVIDFIVRLKPQRRGRHVVILSNCASDVVTTTPKTSSSSGNNTASSIVVETPLTAFIRDIDVHFAFRFGELPLSLMGIIPFYGIIAACYAAMSLAWLLRSSSSYNYPAANNCCYNLIMTKASFCLPSSFRKKKYTKMYNHHQQHQQHPPLPLLGLQKAIRTLVFAQTIFCTIAFTYYLHLNWIADSVDINVLYSGSAAALVHVWDPFSLLLATCHFGTILLAQCVVTLATDGTWLIQHNIRAPTKRLLKTLCGIWILYFALYSSMTTRQRTVTFGLFLVFWISCLLWNIHASLRHLKAVMIGQSNDQILAVGGALVAKRSIYRKMYCIVLMYPIIFVASFIWTSLVSSRLLVKMILPFFISPLFFISILLYTVTYILFVCLFNTLLYTYKLLLKKSQDAWAWVGKMTY